MGVDAYAFLKLGFPISEEDLWTETSSYRGCENNHRTNDIHADFCKVCGKKIDNRYECEPTPGFVELCDGKDPSDTYDELQEEGILCSAKSITSSEDSRYVDIFCASIKEVGGWRGNEEPAGIPLADITHEMELLMKLRKTLGLEDREISLYLQLYWSV